MYACVCVSGGGCACVRLRGLAAIRKCKMKLSTIALMKTRNATHIHTHTRDACSRCSVDSGALTAAHWYDARFRRPLSSRGCAVRGHPRGQARGRGPRATTAARPLDSSNLFPAAAASTSQCQLAALAFQHFCGATNARQTLLPPFHDSPQTTVRCGGAALRARDCSLFLSETLFLAGRRRLRWPLIDSRGSRRHMQQAERGKLDKETLL